MDNCPSKVYLLNKIKNEIDPSIAYRDPASWYVDHAL